MISVLIALISLLRTSFFSLVPYTTLFRSGYFREHRILAYVVRGGLRHGFIEHRGDIIACAFCADLDEAECGSFVKDHDKDRKSTRLNSSHLVISYAVFCLKKTILITRHQQ